MRSCDCASRPPMSTHRTLPLDAPFKVDPVHYMGWARKFSHPFRSPHMTADDIYQEACVGLCYAAQHYDPSRGNFLAYSAYWMRSQMLRTVGLNYRLGRFGGVNHTVLLATRGRRQLKYHDQTPSEFAEFLGQRADGGVRRNPITASDVPAGMAYILQPELSLDLDPGDYPAKGQMGLTTGRVVDPTAWEDLEGAATVADWHRLIEGVRAELTPMQAQVLDERLLAVHPQTLKQVGALYNLSRERIRQHESAVIWRIQRAAEAAELLAHDDVLIERCAQAEYSDEGMAAKVASMGKARSTQLARKVARTLDGTPSP